MRIQSILYSIQVIIISINLLPLMTVAQEKKSNITEPVVMQRIQSPIKLDGKIEEAEWMGIRSLPIKMTIPDYGSQPSEVTEILLAYDDDYLYAAGRLFDNEPLKIQAASFKRDVWTYRTDAMTLVLDTFNDNENGVAFFITPAGTRTDVSILNDAEGAPYKNIYTSWNTFWDVATVQNEHGWFTEMRIPFSSLRFQGKDGKTIMGITASRYIARKNELYTFPLIEEKYKFWGAYKPSQTQTFIFNGLKNHNPFYITPYALGGLGQMQELNNSETAYNLNEKRVTEMGLDAKYGLTNNLTLDFTFNTDFAQIEADDQKINLTRYSLFFPEKRLFFQERTGNFDFQFEDNNRLFYSRRIGISGGRQVGIYGGARLVGRIGTWDVGFINMQTEKFEDVPSENFNVVRFRKQIVNPYSYVGGMVTSRVGVDNSWNSVYGIDGIYRFYGDDYLTVKFAQCFKNEAENKPVSFDPSKLYVNLNRRSDKGLGYNLSFSRSGKDFDPGIGYERRHDFTRIGDRIQYGWFPEKDSGLLNLLVFIEGQNFIRNKDGNVESLKMGPGWEFILKNGITGKFSINQYYEDVIESFSFSKSADIPVGNYTFYGSEGEFSTPRGKSFGVSTGINGINAGSFYDGRRITFTIKPWVIFSRYLQMEGKYQYNRVDFDERNQHFTGHIAQIRTWAFLNVRHSLIVFVQYNSANNALITNLRYRYNPREGCDFYIVYDEGLNTDRGNEIPILPRTSNRTIMMKVNYTFNIAL